METITIGRSSLSGSRIAYGCWRIAGPEGAEATPERVAKGRKAVAAAFEAGCTLFDLADVYGDGESERTVGAVLNEVSGMRSRILIATKCGIRRPGDPDSSAPYRYDFSAGHIILSCEQSLKRLGAECIDIYQLHRPDFLGDPEEVAGAFSRLKQAGKVREFGVSNFNPVQLATLQKFCPMPLIVNQVEISVVRLDCLHDGTLDQCIAEKVTPMAWGPLAGGRISSNDPIDLRDPNHSRRIHLREALDLIARERDTTRSVVAIAWLLKHPAKIVPIIGTTEPEKIREQVKAADLHLSREEWYRLLEAALGQRLP